MSLIDNKAGSAAVDPADYNALVDAVVALQAGGGGSQTVAFVGPYSISHTDFVANEDGSAYADIGLVAAGKVVLGVAWVIVEAFDDSGAINGAQIFNAPSANVILLAGIINLVNTTDATTTGDTMIGADLGAPSNYETLAGVNPRAAVVANYNTSLIISAGVTPKLAVYGWLADGEAGQIDIYLLTATVTAP